MLPKLAEPIWYAAAIDADLPHARLIGRPRRQAIRLLGRKEQM
jgi:hypothetical protein